MIAEAIKAARELGLVDIVVNTTGLTGFAPPSPVCALRLCHEVGAVRRQ